MRAIESKIEETMTKSNCNRTWLLEPTRHVAFVSHDLLLLHYFWCIFVTLLLVMTIADYFSLRYFLWIFVRLLLVMTKVQLLLMKSSHQNAADRQNWFKCRTTWKARSTHIVGRTNKAFGILCCIIFVHTAFADDKPRQSAGSSFIPYNEKHMPKI